uniref:Uncharacterized protein n=1 Tax=Mycena chlorophos TaxID=658473 RepID=A0ABQ0M843_MYCCL|nr:predicted protein [Mycena chlorophos]
MYPNDFLNSDRISSIRESLNRASDAALQAVIDSSVKCFMLRNRLELSENGVLEPVARRRRHYLTAVINPAHRKALTRLVTSNHSLSVEVQRYGDRNHREIPREKCLCRFCEASVEDEPHALLLCEGNNELLRLRAAFYRELFTLDGSLWGHHCSGDAYRFLHATLASRKAVARFARYVHEVLGVYATVPPYWADGYHAR